MNCVYVIISGNNGGFLSGWLDIFVVNVGSKGNNCKIVEGFDVFYFNFGFEVENMSSRIVFLVCGGKVV